MRNLLRYHSLDVVTVAVAFLLFAGVQPLCSQDQPQVPRLTEYVTDLTGTLTWGQISQLNTKLKEFETTTSTQMTTTGKKTIISQSERVLSISKKY
jgi:uncharacterized membrane protein YgcG